MNVAKPLEEIVERVDASCSYQDRDLLYVIRSFGDRSFGPVVTLCGLILVTPIAAIPGVPLIISIIMMTFSFQLILGRRTPWLPKFISRIPVRRREVQKTKRKILPWLRRVDSVVQPRLAWASSKTFRIIAAIVCFILGALLIPLGPVPFGVAIPGFLTLMLGLGLTARDGLFIIVAVSLFFAISLCLGIFVGPF